MQQLLLKYLENRCNAEELDKVLAYLKTEAGQRQLLEMLDQDIHKAETSRIAHRQESDFDQIFERIRSGIAEEAHAPQKTMVPLYRRWYSVAAAAAALVMLAAAGLLWMQDEGFTTYQTAFGETQSITLPDGSVVTLNANSSLSVSQDFEELREVWLNGEAFFEVEKTKHAEQGEFVKFIVHTDRLQVEVLGTSFNVQDWEEKTQVVLKSGKVKLKSAVNEELTMEPGELAEVSSQHASIQKKIVNPDLYSSWTENKLLCHDTPLKEIAQVIEHRYGKEVIFGESQLEQLAVTGTLPLHKLSLLTEVLLESLPINIKAYEETLIISTSKEKPAQ